MPKVSVVAAWPGEQRIVDLDLPAGATAWDAVVASGLLALCAQAALGQLTVGVWSKPCAKDAALREGDRVEIYRPIRADAKTMRRDRARLKPSRRSRNAP